MDEKKKPLKPFQEGYQPEQEGYQPEIEKGYQPDLERGGYKPSIDQEINPPSPPDEE